MRAERWIRSPIPNGSSARAIDWLIAELADRQHQVFAAWQLPGLSRGAIKRRVDRRWCRPVHLGVYVQGTLTREGRLIAAVLACGPLAVLSHRSAGSHHGILRWNGIIEVTVPTDRVRPGIKTHRGALLPDEVTVVDGIPVTTPARTVIDIAPLYDREGLERVLQQTEIRQLWDRTGLQELMQRHAGRRGLATLRTAAPDEDTLRSELERSFRRLLQEERLRRPEWNARIPLPNDFLEVDCVWPEERLALELDSRRFHLNRRAFERDRERDRRLIVAGYRPMRVTDRMIRARSELAADLHAILS